jgi:hypothetical protein
MVILYTCVLHCVVGSVHGRCEHFRRFGLFGHFQVLLYIHDINQLFFFQFYKCFSPSNYTNAIHLF